MVLVSAIFSELNGLYPSAAGIRLYLGRAVGNRTALSVTFTYMTTVILVIAADAFLIKGEEAPPHTRWVAHTC